MGPWEPNTAGARSGSIVGANDGRADWNELVEPGGPMGEVGVEPPEVVKGIVETPGEAQSLLFLGCKGSLQLTEKPTGVWHGKGHGAEFAEQFMPAADR
jgi:hypothetical protein